MVVSYGRVTLKTKDEALIDANGQRYEKELKLVTLFGDTKGNLEFRINQYMDGSGSYCECYPCLSREEADQTVQLIFNAAFAGDDYHEQFAESAKSLGIEVPEKVRNKLSAKAKNNILSNIKIHLGNVARFKKQLGEFESAERKTGSETQADTV